MKAIICVGISGSGKTHWATRQNGYKVICRDDIRKGMLVGLDIDPVLEGGGFWSQWKKYCNKCGYKKAEQTVTEIQHEQIQEAAKKQQNIIIADTNLNLERKEWLRQLLESLGYSVEDKVFESSFEDACQRDAARKDGVGVGVIWRQCKQFYDLYGKKYLRDSSKTKAVIFDIDGTLAEGTNRGPFEFDKVDADDIIDDVAQMFRAYRECGYKMIVVSGRQDSCKEKTLNWLERNNLSPDFLLMRKTGDLRKDSVVKSEIFFNNIAPYFNVTMVVDDRPQVTREWELIGLTVARVANQYEEF